MSTLTPTEARSVLNKLIDLLPKVTVAASRLQTVFDAAASFEQVEQTVVSQRAKLDAEMDAYEGAHRARMDALAAEHDEAVTALETHKVRVQQAIEDLDADLLTHRDKILAELDRLRQDAANESAHAQATRLTLSANLKALREEVTAEVNALTHERDAVAADLADLKAERARLVAKFSTV